MQKNNPKNSALNKALIFVSAFVVSSLIIYQVYYYSKVKSLSSGIVATAAELPNTQIHPLTPKHFSDNNYIGNAGLPAAVGHSSKSSFATAPKENYLSGNGVYNKAFLDELNIGISNKFPNHPPIGFPAKEGEKVLFSYLFKNVVLPKGFWPSNEGINMNGKPFRALQYIQEKDDSSAKIYFYGDSLNLFIIPLDNGAQTLVMSKYSLPTMAPDSFLMKMSSLPNRENSSVIFPEIDFNIIKYWKPEEATFIPYAKDYKHMEERVKIKLSTIHKEPVESKLETLLQPPFYMYLFEAGAQKPYFSLFIANTELLLPVKGK